ncbi:MAG: hypothetical protein IPG87_15910 [Saprospiraceae bacterium]|nr:hypothetical protein [Candidatus Vicinibacter affinis]
MKLKRIGSIWTYYAGTKADEISATENGIVYTRQNDGVGCGNHQKSCNCKLPLTVNESETKYNKKSAKASFHVGQRYRSKVNSISSTHKVIKNGITKTLQLSLGKDCDTYRWWTDWY